jgi:hypothetical protein
MEKDLGRKPKEIKIPTPEDKLKLIVTNNKGKKKKWDGKRKDSKRLRSLATK